jgi:hypothetical protein
MFKISKLQTLDPKDWSGLTTDNHLGALYMQEPILVSEVIENLYRVNLGGDDVVSFINKFPVMYIDDDLPFEWLLQGADEKNIPLITYWDSTLASKPNKPGVARAPFFLEFGERYFEATDVLVGERPDLYKLRVIADPMSRGTSWIYQVQLVTNDDNLFVPAADLAAGTRWSKEYSLVEQTLSKRGGTVSHTSPFRMRNELSMIRKQYTVPGNMIRKGVNKPLAFAWQDSDGNKITSWLGKLDWDFMAQFRRERARLLMYGNSNRMSDGTYGNIGESGYEIRAGYGLYEQIAPSNVFYYNDFDLDWLTEIALGLSVGKLPEDQRAFVLSTGEYGAYQFHKAVSDLASGWTPNFTSDRITISGNKLTYRGQFMEYVGVNGLIFKVFIDPMKDNPVRNKLSHPDGGLAASREYDLLDFGTANGEPNIQRVGLKGDEEIYKYIPGMRTPFDPYNGLTKPGMAASSIGGLRVKNPMRTMRIIPSILA